MRGGTMADEDAAEGRMTQTACCSCHHAQHCSNTDVVDGRDDIIVAVVEGRGLVIVAVMESRRSSLRCRLHHVLHCTGWRGRKRGEEAEGTE